MESFGLQVAQGRKKRNLSQEEVADLFSSRFGILSAATLNELEQDRMDPRPLPGVIDGLATILDLSPSALHALAARFPDAVLEQESFSRSISSSMLAFRRTHSRR
ncbi:MAG: hypothetical protein JWM87_1300 [Candidatus Eremiobacteraeota bacterium]|nr:hypothetical protein [Candidatus Eremiobacteraeota bacterium]